MKTSELIGAELDLWVLRGFGRVGEIHHGLCIQMTMGLPLGPAPCSTDWQWGGPIIENECIELVTFGNPTQWSANPSFMFNGCSDYEHIHVGPTPLIAAMRAFVHEKFGDEVMD